VRRVCLERKKSVKRGKSSFQDGRTNLIWSFRGGEKRKKGTEAGHRDNTELTTKNVRREEEFAEPPG